MSEDHPQPSPHTPTAFILRRLRQFHEGVLAFADQTETVRFVLDPGTGEPVLPVTGLALGVESAVLYLPDDAAANPDCLQITGVPAEIDPLREEACDRHGAYFGRPAHARWARLEVESVKRLDEVVGGELVRLTNPLRKHEGRLCRAVNDHPRELAAACLRAAGVAPESPRMVGIDPWGADVRTRFDVLRIDFQRPVSTPDEGREQLSLLLGVPLPPPAPQTPPPAPQAPDQAA